MGCRMKDDEEEQRKRIVSASRDTDTAARPQQRKAENRRLLGGLANPLDAAALEEKRVRQPQRFGYLRRLLEDDASTSSPLSTLDLTGQGLTDVTAYPVLRALETNEQLRELTLDHNRIGDGSCAALAASLRRNCALQRVSLCFNPITDAGAQA